MLSSLLILRSLITLRNFCNDDSTRPTYLPSYAVCTMRDCSFKTENKTLWYYTSSLFIFKGKRIACLPRWKRLKKSYIYSFYAPLLKVKLWSGSLCFFAWIRKLESISFGVWLDDICDTSKKRMHAEHISIHVFFKKEKKKKRVLILRHWKNRIFMLHMKISLISSLNHSFLDRI
jgi:hypothetical protein